MKQYLENIKNHISDAELVVVGLGEEWNISLEAQNSETYKRIAADLKVHPEYRWLWPYFYYKLTDDVLKKAYETLFDYLEGKNYFVVATTVNRSFAPIVREGRLVMPCGTEEFLRDEILSEAGKHEAFLQSLDAYFAGEILFKEITFIKDENGEIIPFNNIYAPGYKEEGYLPDWSRYMSWLQGTMNRKVCLLELGEGLKFPSVFRFPFEKMAYFNRKATCFRVHKSLYQLTEEMAARSISVPVHAVELFAGEEK